MATGEQDRAGWIRRRHERAIHVGAPRDIVWRAIEGADIDAVHAIPGFPSMRVEMRPADPGHRAWALRAGPRVLTMRVRIVEERPGHALLFEIRPEGTSPEILVGSDDYLGYVLEDRPGGTSLYVSREVTAARLRHSLVIAARMWFGTQSVKRTAEKLARDGSPRTSS